MSPAIAEVDTSTVLGFEMAGTLMSPEEFIFDKTGERPVVVPPHEIYRTPLLPGFELPVSHLLGKADVWE